MACGRGSSCPTGAIFLFILSVLPVLLAATPVAAQPPDPPVGPFVVDLRGSIARFGQNELLAANLGLRPSELPSRGVGVDVAAHWYPLKWRAITFGIGGNLQLSSGLHHIVEDPVRGIEETPRVRTTLANFTPQVSFNFGTGRGWSYISGGVSPTRLRVTVDDVVQAERLTRTINYGGGARWFAKPHVGFTFDLRFYSMSPLEEEDPLPGLPRTLLLVFSVGVSIK